MKKFNGNSLLSAMLSLCLTVVSAHATQQAPVALGSNSAFAILAGTTVTVTGGGTISGNIGISPGTAFVPGIPAVTVSGTIYRGGPIAAQAQADLTLAFNDAAGRQTPVAVAGNIGGQTLTPGLYKSTSSLAISSGDLTLDAQGNPNAVFVFQIASTLTVTSGRQVILAGGANAANIFWQVGSSATLGTTSVFHGNILAAVSITTLTGATLHGRALAQSGAVTVDTGGGNSVTVPVAPTRPVVISAIPSNGATGVPGANKLSANFSVAMDASSINTSTFTLFQGATAVEGTVVFINTAATFTPSSALAPLKAYIATITTGAKDLAGNTLANTYVWIFTTGAATDVTAPTIISTAPANGASGIVVNTKILQTFSEAMDPSTVTAATFTLARGATPLAGTVVYLGTTASFTPASPLLPGTAYTSTVSAGAKDLAGNALAGNTVSGSHVTTFTTGVGGDTTAPTVTSSAPANGATGVSIASNVTIAFSESMDPASITTATVTIQQGATLVPGTLDYNAVVKFLPATPFAPNTIYTGVITTGVRDLAGNSLSSPYIWTFTTGSAAIPAPIISPAGTSNNSSATLNDASYTSPVAAGSIAAVFGTNLAIGQSNSLLPSPLPTTLNQSSITIGGSAAPLYFASPNQVNVQIPWELANQNQASISASVGGVASNVQLVSLAPLAPGLFSMDATGAGQGAILIAPGAQLAAPGSPVVRGGYISIFCTGLGPVTNQPATGTVALAAPLSYTLDIPAVTIGGTQGTVSYSGLAPGLVGLYQVNVLVPPGVPPGDAVPVILTIGSIVSNTVTIAVQ